jgi:hypothetical protein
MKSLFSAFGSSCDSPVNLPLVCVLSIAASGSFLQAQSNGSSSNSDTLFAGAWNGVCLDGKPFILLDLRSTANKIEGSMSLGNLSLADSGASKGGSYAVTDPTSPDHSTSIKDALVDGQKLTFESSPGPHVEIVLTRQHTAKIRFPGAPMEQAWFEISKTNLH